MFSGRVQKFLTRKRRSVRKRMAPSSEACDMPLNRERLRLTIMMLHALIKARLRLYRGRRHVWQNQVQITQFACASASLLQIQMDALEKISQAIIWIIPIKLRD